MRQRHGQNFLIDNNIVNKIITAAELSKDDTVVEIGPGKGILTKAIAPLVKTLTSIEIDQNLFDKLQTYFTFHNTPNINLVHTNFLDFNDFPQTPFKLISNLPYNIGTAIIQKVLPLPFWTSAVFMLQKEVAARVVAKAGSKDYGYISIYCNYHSHTEILFDVSPSCFYPQPKVISSVIKINNKNSPPVDDIFLKLVKHSFSMRRKTVANSLTSFTGFDKQEVIKILDSCLLDSNLRPDKLSIQNFLTLTSKVKTYKIP